MRLLCVVGILSAAVFWSVAAPAEQGTVTLTVTSELSFPRVPMDPRIDFPLLIKESGMTGVLDPNSICVVDTASGETVPHALTEDFAYGGDGRVEWVITHPDHKSYEIRFSTGDTRPPGVPAAYTPLIGTGDLLRFNAGVPRPVVVCYPSGLFDLNGDGKLDLVGAWNYAYRPGWPWDGIVCYPGLKDRPDFEFGDLVHLRCTAKKGSHSYFFLNAGYMTATFADLDGDGLLDMVFSPREGNTLYLYLNTGERGPDGMPVFAKAGTLPRPPGTWQPLQVADFDRDGVLDILVGSVSRGSPNHTFLLRNRNKKGWPIKLEEPMPLPGLVKGACFLDIDGDGSLDAAGLEDLPEGGVSEYRVVWQQNKGGNPPLFETPQPVKGIDGFYPDNLVAVSEGARKGLLLTENVYQNVTFYEHVPEESNKAAFRRSGRAESLSAVMSLSDQAWPYPCDWDGDGDLDLLIGGGYGWPRIVINEGSNEKPAYAEPHLILSGGKPIRLLRNQLLGEPFHEHNMGYSYPVFIDWDGDGLPDLMMPNETNRIYWYKNIGTRTQPEFGPRRQVLVESFPDSETLRALSAKRALADTYPKEREQPFFWRTGAAFADWNGDGTMDLATGDGYTRRLVLFTQKSDTSGTLVLRKENYLRLTDGRFIEDSVVGRETHWTECYRPVDWDGDGLMDLVYSCAGTDPANGSIYLLRNAGNKKEPVFEAPRTLCFFGKPIKVTDHGPSAWAGDLDNDGKADLLTGTEWSVYPFYTHAALEMKERPKFQLGPPSKQ